MWRKDQVENFSDLPYSPEKKREEDERKAEIDERYKEASKAILPERAEPPPDTRPLLDSIRDHLPMSNQARERLNRENYERRRAALVEPRKPATETDVQRMMAWLEDSELDDSEYDEDYEDDDDTRRGGLVVPD